MGAVSEGDPDDGRALCEETVPGHEWELREAERFPEVDRGDNRKG